MLSEILHGHQRLVQLQDGIVQTLQSLAKVLVLLLVASVFVLIVRHGGSVLGPFDKVPTDFFFVLASQSQIAQCSAHIFAHDALDLFRIKTPQVNGAGWIVLLLFADIEKLHVIVSVEAMERFARILGGEHG